MPYYAVKKGDKPGIFATWPECQAQIKDFKGAQYKKFDTIEEAEKFLGFDLAKQLEDEISALKANQGSGDSPSKSSKRKRDEEPKKDKKKTKKESSEDEDDASDTNEDEAEDAALDVSKIVAGPVLDKAKAVSVKDYPTSSDGYVLCYTDGACFNMGKKGQVSGAGVYFGADHKMNLSEPIKDGKPHTSNRAKILAVVVAVEALKASGVKKAQIHLDSEFTINCVDKWTPGWKKKGWKTAQGADVKNKAELQLLDKLSTIDVRYSRAAENAEPSGYSEATRLAKEGAKKTFD